MHSTRPILVSFLPWLPPPKGLGFLKALEATPSTSQNSSPVVGKARQSPAPSKRAEAVLLCPRGACKQPTYLD